LPYLFADVISLTEFCPLYGAVKDSDRLEIHALNGISLKDSRSGYFRPTSYGYQSDVLFPHLWVSIFDRWDESERTFLSQSHYSGWFAPILWWMVYAAYTNADSRHRHGYISSSPHPAANT